MNKIKKIFYKIIDMKDSVSVIRKHKVHSMRIKKVNYTLKYACNHVSYYKKLLESKEIEMLNLKTYPLIDKKIIKDNYNDLISDQKEYLNYFDAYTGGSTGEPLHFLRQKNYVDALTQIKFWKLLGYKLGDKILAMDGTSIPQGKLDNNIYWGKKKTTSLPYGKMFLSSLYLTYENINYYIKFILKYKPTFIRGYPSFVYQISKYMYDNNIKIDFRVKTIQLTSESSFPYQWETISKVFKCKISLQYGHTEASVFGYTYDESMKYKIEPLYGYTEVIKDDGTEAKPGEIGEIVVTSFYNKIMPLIRYKTGDYAIVGEKIGDTIVLENIMGRTQDYIYNKNNEKVLLTALIFGQHFKALGNIDKWQIIQDKIGIVNMKIIKGKEYSIEDENEIKKLFLDKANTIVEIEYVTQISTTKRGKSKLLIQNL